MKKLIFLTVLVVLGMTVSNAQTETKTTTFRWGPTAGVNFSGASGDVDDIDSRTGFRAGVVASLEISELFSVQPEVVYSMRGWKEQNLTIKIDYVEVPIMADFEVVDGLSLQGGPIIGFNISAELVNGMTVDIQDDVESISFGFAIGAQYELPMGLFFNLRYDMGINNINANDNDFGDEFVIRNCNLGLSAGFYID
jgi:hypothetical protein